MSAKKILLSTLATTLIMGTMMSTDPMVKKEVYPRPIGKDHRVNTEEEKANHKAHQKKIKLRRNAKKGIYENKIVYPTNRKARKER